MTMAQLKKAVALGVIYAIDRETGEVQPMGLDTYCALDLDTLERHRFTFNEIEAYAPRVAS